MVMHIEKQDDKKLAKIFRQKVQDIRREEGKPDNARTEEFERLEDQMLEDRELSKVYDIQEEVDMNYPWNK